MVASARASRRLALALALVPPLLLARGAAAQWTPNGAPVCTAPGDQFEHVIASDGAGGAFIAWSDPRSAPNSDVYLQHLTMLGEVAPGWPVDGLLVCSAAGFQGGPALAPDGSGGVFVAWLDGRASRVAVYVQRRLATGAVALGWPTDGMLITAPYGSESGPLAMTADGAGGVYVSSRHNENYDNGHGQLLTAQSLYLRRVRGAGGFAPGWDDIGLFLGGVTLDYGSQMGGPSIGLDTAGNAILNWWTRTPSGSGWRNDILVGAISPDQRVIYESVVRSFADYKPLSAGVVSDGAGGAYAGWADIWGFDTFVWLSRVTATGGTPPGWPGLRQVSTPDIRAPALVTDGAGGAIIAWPKRVPSSYTNWDVLVTRFGPTGARPPGWMPDGNLISHAPYTKTDLAGVPDLSGGMLVTWSDGRNGNGDLYNRDLYGTQVASDGSRPAGWTADGDPICTAPGDQSMPAMVADGYGGGIVAWQDGRNGNTDIYAQRMGMDNPVPTQLALASSVARADGVRLIWYGAGTSGLTATVDRRDDSSDWTPLGTAQADGTGHIAFEDRDVIAGRRYGYRLGVQHDGREEFYGEGWVTVPAAAELALRGATPNPARGAINVALSLPDGAPATLELLDLGGRRLVRRDVGSLGGGQHSIRLPEATGLPPGIYVLRLAQRGRSVSSRVCVLP